MNNLMTPTGGFKYNAGIAYIAIPSDLDRQSYINDCYKNFHVSIRTEDGGFINRVPITPDALNFIDFPSTPNELGTCVLYVTDEQNQIIFITDRFANRNDIGDGRENSFKFRRKYKDRFVEISGSSDEGSINIIANGGEVKGRVNIIITDASKEALLNVDVAGDVQVTSTTKSLLQTEKLVVATDDGDNAATYEQTPTQHKFYGKEIRVNDGEAPMVLGDALNTFLRNFIDEVAKITVAGSPISNVPTILALKVELEKLLSKEAFLNK